MSEQVDPIGDRPLVERDADRAEFPLDNLPRDLPQAPMWRRVVARAIDLTIVLVVFALFFTPVIAAYGRSGTASSILKMSAWVYVGVFVVLAISLVARKRRRQTYVTAGVSIMNLYPVRAGKSIRLVHSPNRPLLEGERRGRDASIVVFPMILIGIALFVFELLSYA